MRLIDADELIKNIPNEEMISKYAVAHAPTIDKFEIAKVSLKEAIDSAETIGDVIEKFIIANRPQGEWIETDRLNCGAKVYQCSICGEDVDEMPTVMGVPKYRFCPYCRARMKGTNDEEISKR